MLQLKAKLKKQFICSDLNCYRKFTSRFSRKRHIQTVHRNHFRFDCDICDKKLRDHFCLLRHKKQKHLTRTIFLKCLLCEYITKKASNLERHCEQMHLGEGLFGKRGSLKCEICGKLFNFGFRLKQHMEIHQAISIGYDCPLCNKKVEEKHVCSYDCKKCDRVYTSKLHFNEHQKIHIRIESIIVTVKKAKDHEQLETQLLNLNFN